MIADFATHLQRPAYIHGATSRPMKSSGTAQMRQEKCFCGERVGMLVPENAVSEEEKNPRGPLDLLHNVGEIIQIELNQATYLAMKDRMGARDFFVENGENGPFQEHKNEMERFIKGYVRNKGMRILYHYQ